MIASLLSVATIASSLLCAIPVAIAAPLIDGTTTERVEFASADGTTTLVGYLFRPRLEPDIRAPAVVMMHGRAGAYSIRAGGIFDATTLSQRHQFWGRWWAEQGYLAILVDGFGPRGYPQGFPRFSYATRPTELDEVSTRPLDAHGALAYLRSRTDVLADRIGLQGWSNGGSATLATMATDRPELDDPSPVRGFRAALAFYPGCGLKRHFDGIGYSAYAPLWLFIGSADEEVSPRLCRSLLQGAGGEIHSTFYKGATHDFDDPGERRQRIVANAEARDDAVRRATGFFAERFSAQLLRPLALRK